VTEERIGIAGDHLTGTELAAALSQEVRYRPLTADAFRALGFPGADDMGNMSQFVAEFNTDNLALRPLAATRAGHPGLPIPTTVDSMLPTVVLGRHGHPTLHGTVSDDDLTGRTHRRPPRRPRPREAGRQPGSQTSVEAGDLWIGPGQTVSRQMTGRT